MSARQERIARKAEQRRTGVGYQHPEKASTPMARRAQFDGMVFVPGFGYRPRSEKRAAAEQKRYGLDPKVMQAMTQLGRLFSRKRGA